MKTLVRLFVLIVLAASAVHAESADHPNLLWLSIEDLGPNFGCYGDPLARTPTLDALAARGVRYTRVFTTAPVCAPSRSCIITGVQAATLGSHPMRSAGEAPKALPGPKLPGGIVCFPSFLRKEGYYCTNNAKQDYNFITPADTWDESNGKAHWRNRQRPDQPFFAVFNFEDTHESKVRVSDQAHTEFMKPFGPILDPAKVTPPPYHPDTPEVRKQWANYYDNITALDFWIKDHLKALDDAGVADNTIVIVWSDHGAGLPRNKRWLYDAGTRVPMIVYAPEKWKALCNIAPSTVDEELISAVDLAPSMLALAGIDAPAYMQGRAFLGPHAAPRREYVYSARDRMDERYDMIRAVRDKHPQFHALATLQPIHELLRTGAGASGTAPPQGRRCPSAGVCMVRPYAQAGRGTLRRGHGSLRDEKPGG